LRVVEAHKKLAKLEKTKIPLHIEAAERIFDNLLASGKLDEFQSRLIEYGRTQLSNGRIDLYSLIGHPARMAKKASADGRRAIRGTAAR
jgi:hypothetical protein